MGNLFSSMFKFTLAFTILYASVLFSAEVPSSKRRRSPASSTESFPSSSLPATGSPHFICAKNGEPYECDVNGQPISHMSGGGATREQLINDCLKSSSSQVACEATTDNLAPYNSIPVSRIQETESVTNNVNNTSSSYDECMRNSNSSMSNYDEIAALCSNNQSTQQRGVGMNNSTSKTCGPDEVLVQDGLGSRCVSKPAQNNSQSAQNTPGNQQQPANGQTSGASSTNPSAYNQPTPDLNLCITAKSAAESECNPESQNWMKAINQVSSLLGSQMNQGACSSLAAAQAGSAASMNLFTVQCGQAVNVCVTECRKSITSTDPVTQATATEAVKSCNAKGVTAKEAEQAAAVGIQKIAQAVQSCKVALGMSAGNLGSQAAYVGKTADDILAGLQPRQDQGLSYEGTGSGLTGDMNANVDLSGLIDDTPVAGVAAKPRAAGQDPGGQQGSAGMGSGGGVGVDANSGKAANRRGNTGLLSNILSGFFGGGGSGLFGGSGRSGTGGGSGGWFGGGSSSTQATTKTPDLRQFLPGAKFDPKKDRGIAGKIISKDGISGPHSNVWRDISNRYQVKRASLLP